MMLQSNKQKHLCLQIPEQRSMLLRLLNSPELPVFWLISDPYLLKDFSGFFYALFLLHHKIDFKILVEHTHSSICHLISRLHLLRELSS